MLWDLRSGSSSFLQVQLFKYMKERFYIINQVVPDLFATWQVLVVSGELNLAGGEDDEAKASLISHVLCQHLLLKLVRTLYLKAGLGIISVDTPPQIAWVKRSVLWFN